jgi:hypothetical protein
MVYELRTYEVVPGRMPALHARFENVTRRFFEKHGIRVIGYWEAVIGTSNQLVWLIEWQDLAERERKWDAFATDPEWLAARAETERDGPIVARATNVILRKTPYSP